MEGDSGIKPLLTVSKTVVLVIIRIPNVGTPNGSIFLGANIRVNCFNTLYRYISAYDSLISERVVTEIFNEGTENLYPKTSNISERHYLFNSFICMEPLAGIEPALKVYKTLTLKPLCYSGNWAGMQNLNLRPTPSMTVIFLAPREIKGKMKDDFLVAIPLS